MQADDASGKYKSESANQILVWDKKYSTDRHSQMIKFTIHEMLPSMVAMKSMHYVIQFQ